ncbi:MAG: polyphosphate polymerase domain-containing protein [Bacteroidales bacterium]|nr:polyphosphate polymerase domain-containing protein [Bacteroidales bacterium]
MLLRYERKYLVPNSLMDALRKRLITFVRPDSFTSVNEKGINQYTVRSIYFDSNDLISYYEKGDGIMFRRKFRVRGYDNYCNGCKVVFEIKRKIEDRIRKHRAFMLFDDVENVFASGDVEKFVIKDNKYTEGVEDAKRFFYHIVKYQFKPTVLIVYDREAYHGKFDSGTRITFDKNIRSRTYTPLKELYCDNNLKYLFDSHFILEIKYYGDNMPSWAKSLVEEFKLRHEALSKYTIGYDVNNLKSLQLY